MMIERYGGTGEGYGMVVPYHLVETILSRKNFLGCCHRTYFHRHYCLLDRQLKMTPQPKTNLAGHCRLYLSHLSITAPLEKSFLYKPSHFALGLPR